MTYSFFITSDVYTILENKYCHGDNPVEYFDSNIDAKAYCDANPSCIGYVRMHTNWVSCALDSIESPHCTDCTLYKKGNGLQ